MLQIMCPSIIIFTVKKRDKFQFNYMYSFEKNLLVPYFFPTTGFFCILPFAQGSLRFSIEDRVIYQACPCSDHMGISGSTRTVQRLYVGPFNVFFPNIKLSMCILLAILSGRVKFSHHIVLPRTDMTRFIYLFMTCLR